nr:hypothetical protein [Tanacetum cinerariifolium]
GNPHHALKDKGVIDSGCSRHMTGNMSYLTEFKEINGGYVAFGGNPKGGKITGKCKIRIGKLDFDDVYFVKELKFNLFSVSQMCDKKNSVLFTDTECIVLSFDFKLPDENHVLLRVPKENNIKKRTLIEATRTMLADSLLPIPFWAEAVNTGCYDQNRVLVTKPHNKTPYELLLGRTPSIGFIRPFGCHVTILNTLDPLGKCDGKADERFLIGYSISSKAFRVFNSRIRIVQETLHINFLENQPNVAGSRPTCLFDIDTLTKSMNYHPVITGNQPNPSAGIQEHFDADKAREGNVQQYVLFPYGLLVPKILRTLMMILPLKLRSLIFEVNEPETTVHVSPSSSAKSKKHDGKTKREAKGKSPVELSKGFRNLSEEFEDFFITALMSAAGPSNTADSPTLGKYSYVDPSQHPDDLNMPALEDIAYSDDKDVGAEADFSNLETNITVSPIPTTKVHKDHPVTQIISDLSSAPLIRSFATKGPSVYY